MSRLNIILRRELRVALSRRAQPVWFRVAKWIFILVNIFLFRDRSWFWGAVAGLTVMAFSLHFLYRWKTRTWTRAWGGWNDLAAGRD